MQREAQEVWKQHQQLRLAQDEVLRLREEVAAGGASVAMRRSVMRSVCASSCWVVAGAFLRDAGPENGARRRLSRGGENGLNVCSPQKPGFVAHRDRRQGAPVQP